MGKQTGICAPLVCSDHVDLLFFLPKWVFWKQLPLPANTTSFMFDHSDRKPAAGPDLSLQRHNVPLSHVRQRNMSRGAKHHGSCSFSPFISDGPVLLGPESRVRGVLVCWVFGSVRWHGCLSASVNTAVCTHTHPSRTPAMDRPCVYPAVQLKHLRAEQNSSQIKQIGPTLRPAQ